jgi:hypothetical protein
MDFCSHKVPCTIVAFDYHLEKNHCYPKIYFFFKNQNWFEMTDADAGAEYLASIFGTEKDK